MGAPARGIRFIFRFPVLIFCAVPVLAAVGPANVLVLYNNDQNSTVAQAGQDIANHYKDVYPNVQLLGLTVQDFDPDAGNEQITDDYYLGNPTLGIVGIREQILNSGLLTSDIDVVVTTKGLPLRIYVDHDNPGVYQDPVNGTMRQVLNWKRYSSLESELTRVDVISTWQQMGDQSYQWGHLYPFPAYNPLYYNPNYPDTVPYVPFDHDLSEYADMRLTARLDGFDKNHVINAINKSSQADLFVYPTFHYVVADNDPAPEAPVDCVLIDNLKDNVLAPTGQAYCYNNTDAAITTAPGPVIGYVSHGTNDGPDSEGLETGYIEGQLNFTLADGAVFYTHESYNAFSFQAGGNHNGQGLVAEWLKIGGTAGVGNVHEPFSGIDNEANEEQMFRMLLQGYNWTETEEGTCSWAEAVWSSIEQLSYCQTIVGDPLMTWKVLIAGDANKDGYVDIEDLSILGANWGDSIEEGDETRWAHADFNLDGIVNIEDLSILGANWGGIAPWAEGGGGGGGDEPLNVEAFLDSIPEPSTAVLAVAGLLTLLVGYGWRYRRPH